MAKADPHNLQRFVAAQEPVYPRVVAELRGGRKRTHWMWFIFPQIRGLGASATSVKYAISSLQEAQAYLQHEVLGPRLLDCTALVNQVEGRAVFASKAVDDIFGFPDNLKFHSSMTLFSRAAPEHPAFQQALQKYFAEELDQATLKLV